jgi:predicted naringenin-chalcone synthase
MPKTYLTAIGTANPPFCISQAQTIRFMTKALHLNTTEIRKLTALYRLTAIEQRYSVLEDYTKEAGFSFYPNEAIDFPTTAQRAQCYEQYALPLAIQAVQDALREQQGKLPQITHLITVSCTGMYAPGLDIQLVEALGLSPSVQRTCINFMGCYASFNALKLADAICRSDTTAKVLIAGVELCTLHLQKSKTEDDLLSGALFADGAAAVLLEAQPTSPKSLLLQGFHCDLATDGKKDMAWRVGNFGFEMRLSTYVPAILAPKVRELVGRLLAKFSLNINQIDLFAIHPGGRRIVEVIGQSLEIPTTKNHITYEVLRQYGNMSSVTVLFVLKKIFEQLTPSQHQQKIVSMAFGPGLTLESALLEVHWED